MTDRAPRMTHATGSPVVDNTNIQTAGPRGPALLQDIWLLEQNQASYFGTFGYGNPAYNNSGCRTPTAASFATGTSATCVADNRRIADAKIGFWQDLYKGRYGRCALGVELEYLKRTSFDGIGGVVSTDNIIAFTSLRYYY